MPGIRGIRLIRHLSSPDSPCVKRGSVIRSLGGYLPNDMTSHGQDSDENFPFAPDFPAPHFRMLP